MKDPSSCQNDKKKISADFGHLAEKMARDYYISQGYVVLETNWRHNKIEIDLICRKDNIIIFVEVKARATSHEDAAEAVNYKKRRSMVRGAEYFLVKLQGYMEYRFDIVTVAGNLKSCDINVIEDAFVSPLF